MREYTQHSGVRTPAPADRHGERTNTTVRQAAARIGSSAGNQSVQAFARGSVHGATPPSALAIAPGNSPQESHARSVGAQAAARPATGEPLTTHGAGSGLGTLSSAGAEYFEPLVGASLAGARVHVDAHAGRLADMAGANAVAYGSDVFIPPDRFSPDTPGGRSLLAHELAHVAHARSGAQQLYRDEKPEAHYPTAEEQRAIAKALGRDFKDKPAPPASTPSSGPASTPASVPASTPASGPTSEPAADKPAEPLVEQGTALTEAERTAMAATLAGPLYSTLTGTCGTGGESNTSTPAPTPLTEAEAFKAVSEAQAEIVKLYGPYTNRQITLTQDASTTPAKRKAAQQLLVSFASTANAGDALARTLVDTHCKPCGTQLNGLNDESRSAVTDLLVEGLNRDHGDVLNKVAPTCVGGVHSASQAKLTVPLSSRAMMYGSVVHELVHAYAHPAFHAAFIDERNIIEGFTEYFTRQIVSGRSNYAEAYNQVVAARKTMGGPFTSEINKASSEESLRMAYFGGRLDLIGWKPSGPGEKQLVEEAGGAAEWDPAIAETHVPKYREQAQQAQDPHKNILGVGMYFTPEATGSNTFSVRYARVLAQTSPYARGRLLLEGQFWGSPVQNPGVLGGSLGIGGEYQDPYFYAGGGVRFVGSAATANGTGRLDISPFAGAGVRAWQRVRVGAEGFVLFPVTGQSISPGIGLTVGIEFR